MFDKRKVARLRAEQEGRVRKRLNALIGSDGTLSEASEQLFLDCLDENGYADEEGIVLSSSVPEDVANLFTLALARSGRFAESTTGLLLKHGEVAYCERGAELLEEVVEQEARQGSPGFSIPFVHGVQYSFGGKPGRMVTTGRRWLPADDGFITVTDRRAVFHGTRRTLEFPFPALVTLAEYSDAVVLGVTTREATSAIRVADPGFVVGMVRAALNASRT
jgi:hypothetical protein